MRFRRPLQCNSGATEFRGGGSSIIALSVFLERRTELLIRVAAGPVFLTGMLIGPVSGPSQALDGVIASVGSGAITRSDVEREYRLERLIEEGRVPKTPPDAAAFDRVLNRVIDQSLLAQEASAEGLDSAGVRGIAAQRLAGVRKKFPSAGAFDSALRSLGMDEKQLLEALEKQERTLEMINQRLRPSASPDREEIEAYYRETFLPEYARRGKGAPPALREVEGQIREILVQKKIDDRLSAWLKELRSTHKVKLY